MTRDELSSLRERVGRLEAERDAARLQADQWREVAEERRVVLERLRQHPVIRLLLAMREQLAPVLRVVRRVAAALRATTDRARRVAGAARALSRQRGVAARRRRLEQLRRQLDARPPTRVTTSVSVVLITRDGGPDLEGLLASLDRTLEHLDGEVVVVDNGGGAVGRALTSWSGTGRRVLVMDEPSSFSAANNRGVYSARGEVVCFLNDDVAPVNRDWLGDMLAALATPGTAVVGAQLLYAPQPAMQRRFAELSVQHLGITMQWRGEQVPRPVNLGSPEVVDATDPVPVAAVTAACLAARREDLLAVECFDEGYDFGAEDVDLCLKLRRLGEAVVVPRALLLHHEGATRRQDPDGARAARQHRNWVRFESLHGPTLWHDVARDRIAGRARLADRPLRIAITVTRHDPALMYGDLVTARRLGEQLERLGHVVDYVERYRDAWYDMSPDVDVVVVLLDTFDVRRVARPGLTVVAWIRNWEARWTAHPWAACYDLVLTSGAPEDVGAAFAPWGVPVAAMPLAPASIPEDPPPSNVRTGVVTTVNHWGDDRGIPGLVAAVPALELYGKGWEDVPAVAANWRGVLPPEDVAALYRRADVVVDVSAPHTRSGGSVNARVFDALANGAVVVSNQPGVRRLFGDDVPVFSNPTELAQLLEAHAADPRPLRDAARRARDVVLEGHTWPRRGEQLRDQLLALANRRRVALLTGAPDGEEGRTWGDTHLAEAFGRALRRRGLGTTVVPRPRWDDSATRAADVTVHLKGRGRAPVAPGQLNVLWVISHPEEVADDELAEVDLVLAASARLAEHFRLRTSTPVHVLRQATDVDRFRPGPVIEEHRTPVVFVGNSRFVERPLVSEAVRSGLELVVHGGNWDRFLPASVLGRSFVPNEDVPDVYRSADVVLNDHWDVMRSWGIVSNRVFDALACEACVVSDHVDELDQLFGPGVATVASPDQLGPTVRELLADPERRRRVAKEGRRRVLDAHTFDHRAAELHDLVRRYSSSASEEEAGGFANG